MAENLYAVAVNEFEQMFGNRGSWNDTREVKRRLQEAAEAESERVVQGITHSDIALPTKPKLYAPKVDVDKVEDALRLNSLEAVLVNDPASPLLPAVYILSAQNFPVTEIDTPDVWTSCIQNVGRGIIFNNPTGKSVYLRYICAGVVDRKGNFDKPGSVIAAADGIFEAGYGINTLYLSHIATKKGLRIDARRLGIASALENAMLVACEPYVLDAEQKLGVTFPATSLGTKVQAMTIEVEPANRADILSLKATVGRFGFHGINGTSVCEVRQRRPKGDVGGVRYAQSDTTHGSYNPRTWLSVPLYLGVRLIGNENAESISGEKAKALLDLMYDGFESQGMPIKGVEADRAYAKQRIGKYVTLHQLPTDADAAIKFVREQGDAYQMLKGPYRDHLAWKQTRDDVKPTLSVEDIKHFVTFSGK